MSKQATQPELVALAIAAAKCRTIWGHEVAAKYAASKGVSDKIYKLACKLEAEQREAELTCITQEARCEPVPLVII